MRRSATIFASLFALVAVSAGLAYAHAVDQSYVFLRVHDQSLEGRVEIAMAEINAVIGANLPTDQTASEAAVFAHIDEISNYVREHVSLSVDGGPFGLPLTGYDLDDEQGQYLRLHFLFDNLASEPTLVQVNYSMLFAADPDHRGMLVIEHNWKTATFENEAIVSLVFQPGAESQSLDLSDSSIWRGFIGLVGMGTHHIWIGIDHILFLLALLLPSVMTRRAGSTWQPVPSFREALIHVVKIVSVFTIAHTITLSIATLTTISLSSRFVESVIAISIAIAALDIVIPIFRQRIWWIVFAFGLFHGFGFASVLSDIGISSSFMLPSLLGFNIGVELGQLAIVCAIFPLLFLLRNLALYRPLVLHVGAGLLVVVSMYWFVERAFLIDLPAGAVLNSVLAAVQ